MSRYIIGIDLGTTNTCVSYVDTFQPALQIQSFSIFQLTSAGSTQSLPVLPSFCYITSEQEWPKGTIDLPWKGSCGYIVGVMARSEGSKVPSKLVQSAKSWLCHAAAHRRDKILPVEMDLSEEKISPIEASARYLQHIKEAWNYRLARENPDAEFESQEVVLTVPASFDEAARTLTAEAARIAGVKKLTLLEEPQAAFYSWISVSDRKLNPGSLVLVCDVGGGTTDFSLIEVQEDAGSSVYRRMAVGEHLLLGGDNIDAAVAYFIEGKLKQSYSGELSHIQWLQLLHEARKAKEVLFAEDAPKEYQAVIQGKGSSVVGGSLHVALKRDELQPMIQQGFFGDYEWKEALAIKKASGLKSMGLPYEDEPSIIKHLARFLYKAGTAKAPRYVLFNGGTMKARFFKESVLTSLKRWYPETIMETLPSYNLDLAVARGAAYYGKARRGLGIKIGGGTARSLYLCLEVVNGEGEPKKKALTLISRGAEEGHQYEPENVFHLLSDTPVSFTLLSSHVRIQDGPGDLIEIDKAEMQPLPPIQTVLRFGKKGEQHKIPVKVHVHLSPIGTLELALRSLQTEHEWSLEFQLKSSGDNSENYAERNTVRQDETFDSNFLKPAKKVIQEFYQGGIHPSKFVGMLEEELERPKGDWSASLLRGLWEPLKEMAPKRALSQAHEVRWWNLCGYFLRPGFGYPLDEHRSKDLWKIILGDRNGVRNPEVELQKWICYRRIAGGLYKGQQTQICAELIPEVLNVKRGKGEQYRQSERVRVLGAMELIDTKLKIKVGEAILTKIVAGQATSAEYWTLARLGARQLVYGSLSNILPREICEKWIEKILILPHLSDDLIFVLGQLGRHTDYREVNISQKVRDKIVEHLPDTFRSLLTSNSLTPMEEARILGDQLPSGLQMIEMVGMVGQ